MNTKALTLVELSPKLAALKQWCEQSSQPELLGDLGYAVYACAKTVFGNMVPKPFALQELGNGLQMVGYTGATAGQMERAVQLFGSEPLALRAIGAEGLRCRAMPTTWESGETLRFTVRAATIVRSRSAVKATGSGKAVEVDVGRHPAYAVEGQPRDRAYLTWLAQQLDRGGAASLIQARMAERSEVATVRRSSRTEDQPWRKSGRDVLPSVLFKGTLCVRNAEAFAALLERGVGRHRAFGFGCVLLAAG